jgi:hypothetical protein
METNRETEKRLIASDAFNGRDFTESIKANPESFSFPLHLRRK